MVVVLKMAKTLKMLRISQRKSMIQDTKQMLLSIVVEVVKVIVDKVASKNKKEQPHDRS